MQEPALLPAPAVSGSVELAGLVLVIRGQALRFSVQELAAIAGVAPAVGIALWHTYVSILSNWESGGLKLTSICRPRVPWTSQVDERQSHEHLASRRSCVQTCEQELRSKGSRGVWRGIRRQPEVYR